MNFDDTWKHITQLHPLPENMRLVAKMFFTAGQLEATSKLIARLDDQPAPRERAA